MFYCIGENDSINGAIGIGQTIQDAIINWASTADILDAITEFKQCNPRIIEGTEIEVSVELSIKATLK